jgi:hypothetical protein
MQDDLNNLVLLKFNCKKGFKDSRIQGVKAKKINNHKKSLISLES